jgi:hypothetical protein
LTGSPGNPSTWYKDFDKEFPEIAAFVETLPIEGAMMFGFILQKPADEITDFNPHAISTIHTDEFNGFGLRMYINAAKNRMRFFALKEGDIQRQIQSASSTKSLDIYHTLDSAGKPVYDECEPVPHSNFHPISAPTKFKDANTVFLMSNVMASHYVQHEDTNDKITFLLSGRRSVTERYNWDELDKKLQESMMTRPDEILTYQDVINLQKY